MSSEIDWDPEDFEDLDDPEAEEWYVKMLDAVGEYMDGIAQREDPNINQRDITIIRALIDFYGFEYEDMMDVLEDLVNRTEELEIEEKNTKQ
jgi:hypothetical protein